MSSPASAEWWRRDPAAETGVAMPVAEGPQEDRASGGAWAFCALMTFTFMNLLAPQTFLPALAPLRLALVSVVVGITAHVAGSLRDGRPLTIRSPEMALMAGLVCLAVASVPASFWPSGTVNFLLDLYFKTVALFWLLANVVNTLRRLRKILWALSLMAVPLALTGINNFVSGGFMKESTASVKRILGYDSGVAGNPNDLALMLNLILSLTLSLLFSARGALARGLLLGIVVLEVAGVVVTFSRSGFLTLATILGIYLYRLARNGRTGWAAAAFVAGLVGLAFVPSDYVSRIATIGSIESDRTGSAKARWEDMGAALEFVLHHPIVGAGAGMNMQALNETRGSNHWVQVHNLYLELAVELGLPGLTVFLLLLRACLGKVRRIRRSMEAGPAVSELSRLAEGIEIALLGFVVAGFFYPVAYRFYFYYMAGLSVAAGAVHQQLLAPEGSRS